MLSIIVHVYYSMFTDSTDLYKPCCRNISKAKNKEGGGGVVTNFKRLKIK